MRIVHLMVLLCLPLSILAQTFIAADDPRLAYTGRISWRNSKVATFTYPGITVNATFYGTQISMKTKPGSGYFMAEVDTLAPRKVHSSEGDSIILLASGLSDSLHTLRLAYCHEGLTLHPAFYGLLLDAGRTLGIRPSLPQRSIEFIGNSITCGFGNEANGSEKRHSWDKSNVYYAYEGYLSRALDAQCWIVSRGGIGIYRNNNGKVNGDRGVLPDIYPYTLFGMSGERWDFNRNQPQVVCVNLGTNDTTGPKYDVALLTAAYVKFLKTLRGYYPQAHIILLAGPMTSGKRLDDIRRAQQQALEEVGRTGEQRAYRFDFTPDDGSLGYGIFKHPSRQRHEKMAQELEPFIRKIAGW